MAWPGQLMSFLNHPSAGWARRTAGDVDVAEPTSINLHKEDVPIAQLA